MARWSTSAALLAALVCALPHGASAQRVVAGVVTDRASSAPLTGVYVALERQEGGERVAAVLTDETGRFALSAPTGGSYRLRAERVGLATEVTGWFVPGRDAVAHRITMSESAVELEGLHVRAPVRTCRLDPAEATLVQRWWEEVRKALQITALGEANDAAGLRFERFERVWSSNLRALRREHDLPGDSTPSRPFLSQDAARLSEHGFVQGREGERLFLAPDAGVLFSATFLGDHCLRVADAAASPEDMGAAGGSELRLAVEPTRERPPDIRGVLAVDTASGELRSFDFSYVNLPADLPASRAGGHLSFAYLSSGAWVVSEWWIRLPQVQYRGGEGSRRGSVPVVVGYVDQGGRAVRAGGEPVDTRLARGTVTGVVYDSLADRPLAGARVSVVGSRYATRTSPDGHFTLEHVPAGRRGVTFHHPALARLGLPSPVVGVEVRAGATDTTALALPGFATAARLLCPDPAAEPGAILTGSVLVGARAEPAPTAKIRARWIDVTQPAARSMRSEEMSGSGGHYALCGLPSELPVTLAVRVDSTWREAGTVALHRGRIEVRALHPGAEATAALRGTVRDAGGGTSLAGADVWVLAVTGDTVARTSADSVGAFHLQLPPGVGYRAVAAREGYLQEASPAFTVEGAESLGVDFELVRDPGAVAMEIEGIEVDIEARHRAVAKRLLRQYGQNEITMGRRWIGRAALDAIPSTGAYDPGVAIARQAVPGVHVDEAAKYGPRAHLCVQMGPRRCAIVILNGARVDPTTALQIDFRELEGIAVLRPEDATTFYGTEGGGGAVILWMRGGR